MTRGLIGLTGGIVALWLVVALPLNMNSAVGLIVSAGAALFTLIPALMTFVMATWAGRRSSEERLLAVLGGTLLRLLFAVGGAMIIYVAVPEIRTNPWPLLTWGLIFYIAGLTGETVLLMVGSTSPETMNVSVDELTTQRDHPHAND